MNQQGKTFGDLKTFDSLYYLNVYRTGSLFFHVFTIKDIREIESRFDHCSTIVISTFCGHSIRFYKDQESEKKILGYYSDIDCFFDEINPKLKKIKRDISSMNCDLHKKFNAIDKLTKFLHLVKEYAPRNKSYYKRLNLMVNIYDEVQIFEENV